MAASSRLRGTKTKHTVMEQLLKIPGTELPEISAATFSLFIPLLLRSPAIQTATPPQTHRYGPLPSQELDVYYPPPGTALPKNHSKPPIFIFYYGGGYIVGRKQMPITPPDEQSIFPRDLHKILQSSPGTAGLLSDPNINDLYHQNIGTFISSHGFITIIPDYRLVPMTSSSSPYNPSLEKGDAIFPSGAEDVLLSIKWAVSNLNAVADTTSIYVMGHSAGGNHLMSAFLLPSFLPSHPELLASIRKIITLSATFSYIHSRESRRVAWSRYFGGFDKIAESCPLGLLKILGDGEAAELPELACLYAEGDHDGAKLPQGEFWKVWLERGGRCKMEVVKGKGHNHMSTVYGVGCGDRETEEWLEMVLQLCLKD